MKLLLKNISIYGFGEILSKSIQFLLLPLYTRVLVPADYGKLELVYMVGAILAILFGFLIQNGYARIYFDKAEDEKFKERLFGTAFFFILICSLAFLISSIIFSKYIAHVVFSFEDGETFVKLIGLSIFLKAISEVPYKSLIVRAKAKPYVSVHIITLLVTMLLTILFVAVYRWEVKGVLYAQIIGGFIQFLILAGLTFKIQFFAFSITQLSDMLKFSVFLILPNLSSFILHLSNRFFIKEYQNLEEVGLYSLGYKIASIIPILFTEPVKKAFAPHIYSLIHNPSKCKQEIKKFSRYFFAAIITFALSISIFSRELIIIMSDQSYHKSYSIVFILAVSYVFLGLSGIIVIGIQITKKTWIITLIWPLSAIISLMFNYILIPSYGRMGAAIAALISFFFINVAYFIALSRVYKIDFEYWKYLYVLILMSVFYLFSTQIQFSLFLSFILKILLLIIFLICILFGQYFNREEIDKFLKPLISKLKLKNSKIKTYIG